MDNLENKILKLLNNKLINNIEKRIAQLVNSKIENVDINILAPLYKNEILISQIPFDDVEKFIHNNQKLIINFAQLLLKDKNIEALSNGISITYSIYLILLIDDKDNLLNYLEKRQIPEFKKFHNELCEIYNKVTMLI